MRVINREHSNADVIERKSAGQADTHAFIPTFPKG